MCSIISRSISILNFSKRAYLNPKTSLFITQPRMSHNLNKLENNARYNNKNQERIRSLVNSDPTGGWEKCWEEGLTPWDLGKPTPVLLHLHETGALPKGRALIPGCGGGHDVMTIASPERYVVGLDISEKAIQKAKQLSCSSPNADNLTFLKEDFFSWRPTELFDLIFDYTFFCAIDPDMRSLWASRIHELLKPDGELITLIFPISNHEGGPPYGVSVNNYEDVLRPIGIEAISIVDNEMAVAPRRGREKLTRWKRVRTESLL